jgi:ribosomal protein S18 acetylase RimI-like enzyme
MIRPLASSDAELCDAIIGALPEWFGVEAGIEDCAAAVRSQDGLVSLAGDDVVGFITWEDRFPETTEITWAAVHPEHHRQGHGRALVAEMLRIARARGVRLAVVHTLSSTAPDPYYEQTRAFWQAAGFIPAAERPELWNDPENPALLLAREV